jgi:asparagine synthase (glutamine-hydrolysing)
MTHRGPDDAGEWRSSDGHVGFGHRRLSILDLSKTGRQPMASKCGRYIIVYNGETYNYRELKQDLQNLGHIFEGNGDTEVVLAAYVHWGEGCVKRFNGMFAFALWDKGDANTTPSLFLARDRAGEKPLYYSHDALAFAFASELKSIPREFRSELDIQALNHYLALGYIPGHLSIASGVAKLPPAHAARYFPEKDVLNIWKWWEPPLLEVCLEENKETLAEQAEAILQDSVRLRMRSDVPVGILLSGGLDSSLVVACAAKASSQPIKTFTIGQPGSKLDETSHADIVARHFNTQHHLLEVPKPSLSILEEIAPFVDEPLADSSLIPAYMVSKLTADHVKVALGGDGGDELFGGYGHYTTAMADKKRWGWLPDWAFRLGAMMATGLPSGVPGRNRVFALRGGPYQSLVWGSPYFDAAARKKILSRDLVDMLGSDFLAPERFKLGLFQTGVDPIDSMTRTDFGSILPDDYLVKVDRASMAVSLEIRCPFLDSRLINFAFGRIPSELKVKGTESRRLQKLIGTRLLPPALDINRKQGFSIPMDKWLLESGSDWFDKLKGGLCEGINRIEVDSLIAGHLRGRTNGARLFSLIMLSIANQNLTASFDG